MRFSTPSLDAPALGRATPVMRDRRHIRDGDDLQPVRLQRTDGRLAAGTWPLDEYFDRAHTVFHCLARRGLGRQLCGVGRALARAFESVLPCARPADHVARWVGNGHDRIIERALNMRLAARDILLLAALAALPFCRAGRAGLLLLRHYASTGTLNAKGSTLTFFFIV